MPSKYSVALPPGWTDPAAGTRAQPDRIGSLATANIHQKPNFAS
jgi:hypothetical protein